MSDQLTFEPEEVEGSLPARFARVAALRPDALAVSHEDTRLTHAEVARRTDGLAALIMRGAAFTAGAPVVVLVADPVLAILGLLAAWKAGALGVPLNPDHPPAYLDTIVRDVEPALVLLDGRVHDTIGPISGAAPQLRVDGLDLDRVVEPPRPPIRPEDPACLIFTSGSTGEPKGVLRSHRAVLYRARCSVTSHGIQADDRLSMLHALSSSPSIRDVVAAFAAGASVLPWDMKRAGPRALAAWIERERVTVLGSAVSMFRPLLAEPGIAPSLRTVRVVHLGSEPLYRQDVERFRERFAPGCLLVGGYGSTEAVPIVEHHIGHDTPLPLGRVPAGHGFEGVDVLVLDDDGRPVASGQPGEIAVRSRYLADGYWRRPDLTRERFRPDPDDPALRIYRTGDVGRVGADGCLEVLGRQDEQVKVRGHRVHPGQVEAALTEHAAVRHAVVTAPTGPDGSTRLVAYLVPETAPPPHPAELRRFLRERLPAHLVPSVFVVLATMPLSPNGKADRAALPPPPDAPPRSGAYVPPRNPIEHQIAGIFEKLFERAPIGATDDFFDLGGDSLLAAALMSAIEETCGRSLAPSVLLEASTVAGLGGALLRDDHAFDEPLTVLRASGTRAPLFFVHNDHGRGLYTHALGRALDPERPVYAIHLHGLGTRGLPDTVEAIAAERVRAVREATPRGPYVMGGHCFGGIVALEMARQLRAAGETVEAVVLIDTPAPGWRARVLHRLSRLMERVDRITPAMRAALIGRVDRATEAVDGWVRGYRTRLGVLARSGPRRQAHAVGRRLAGAARRLARLGKAGLEPAHAAPPDAAAAAWRTYAGTIRRYVPGGYEGTVTLFRAEELETTRPDLGWGRFLPRLEVEVIPGDHLTCVTRHVAAFASRLEARLARPSQPAAPGAS